MPDKVAENLAGSKKLPKKKNKSEIIFLRKRFNRRLTTGSDEERILKTLVVILVGFPLSCLPHCKYEFRPRLRIF
jgi:hypothetical protein